VATPLSEALSAGALDPARLLPLIDAREQEAYGDFMTQADWRDWLMAGPGGLAVAAAAALGVSEPERCRTYGAAYGVAGLLRANLALARQQRCLLPADLLRAHGLLPEGFVADPTGASARAVLQAGAEVGQALLAEAPPVPRNAIPAILPAVLARRDFSRPSAPAMPRGLGDRLAVMLAALTGRVR
jgi:phytoene synthase